MRVTDDRFRGQREDSICEPPTEEATSVARLIEREDCICGARTVECAGNEKPSWASLERGKSMYVPRTVESTRRSRHVVGRLQA